MKKDVKYPRKSKYADRTSSVTSIINSNVIYMLYFSTDLNECKYSPRFIKIINNETWITPLLQSQFRKSFQHSDIEYLNRKWDHHLRLK